MTTAADPFNRFARYLLVFLGVSWCVVRFLGLENAPYGIWMDESRVALHTTCLLQTGRPAGAALWPFFAPAFGDGHHPSTLLYTDALWTFIFGNSMAVFRSVSAVAILATIAGLVAISKRLAIPHLTLFTFVSAALSPWSFQFSRIAWEGPLAPAFMVWSVHFLLMPPRWHRGIAVGVLGGLAMFTYPPLRVAVPLVLLTVGAIQISRGQLRWRDAALPIVSMLITMSPVIWLTLAGKLSGRTMSVAIFAPDYLDAQRGATSRGVFFVGRFLDNLLLHFRPSYLFFTGDENRRHSPGLVGQLSPVDAVAWVALPLLLLWRQTRQTNDPQSHVHDVDTRLSHLMWLGALGFLYGSIPAALTWDALPHALRSIGAWPWACLASAAAAAWLIHRVPRAVYGLTAVAVVYSLLYLPSYFRTYRTAAVDDFRRDLKEAIDARGASSAAAAITPYLDKYSDDELRYYLIRWDNASCRQSRKAMEAVRNR